MTEFGPKSYGAGPRVTKTFHLRKRMILHARRSLSPSRKTQSLQRNKWPRP